MICALIYCSVRVSGLWPSVILFGKTVPFSEMKNSNGPVLTQYTRSYRINYADCYIIGIGTRADVYRHTCFISFEKFRKNRRGAKGIRFIAGKRERERAFSTPPHVN